MHPQPLALDDAALAALVRDTHGFEVRAIGRLGGEHAVNARLETSSGVVMCKVFACAAADADAMLAQQRWQRMLAERLVAAGLPAAATLADRRGASVSTRFDDGPLGARALLVQVSDWIDGEPLVDAELDAHEGRALRRSVGALAGRVVDALHDAPRPPSANDHVWAFETMPDAVLTNLARAGSAIGRDDAGTVRALVERFRGLGGAMAGLPSGVTHHDLHDDNLLVARHDGGPRIVGVLDFDDARVAPLVAEPAIAAAYAARRANEPIAALHDVVDGYRAVRDLSSDELDVLVAGAGLRLALNAVVWTARVAAGVTPEYGAARLRGTWPAVRALAGTSA